MAGEVLVAQLQCLDGSRCVVHVRRHGGSEAQIGQFLHTARTRGWPCQPILIPDALQPTDALQLQPQPTSGYLAPLVRFMESGAMVRGADDDGGFTADTLAALAVSYRAAGGFLGVTGFVERVEQDLRVAMLTTLEADPRLVLDAFRGCGSVEASCKCALLAVDPRLRQLRRDLQDELRSGSPLVILLCHTHDKPANPYEPGGCPGSPGCPEAPYLFGLDWWTSLDPARLAERLAPRNDLADPAGAQALAGLSGLSGIRSGFVVGSTPATIPYSESTDDDTCMPWVGRQEFLDEQEVSWSFQQAAHPLSGMPPLGTVCAAFALDMQDCFADKWRSLFARDALWSKFSFDPDHLDWDVACLVVDELCQE
jgi:hypothetical protein